VASDTSGQKEAAHLAPGAVELYRAGDPESLRMLLQQLVLNREKLKGMRASAWEAGDFLCWENEAPKLVEAVVAASAKHRVTQ
jgi:hypothetical protein